MSGRKNVVVALVLGFALTATATPVLARSGAAHPGYQARAQAIGGAPVGGEVSAHRAAALRECNERGGKSLQYVWGNTQSDQTRACMAERGEAE